MACEADEVLEPEGFETQLGAQLTKLRRDRVLEEIVARNDCHGRKALIIPSTEPAQESQTIDERHPQIENDRVGPAELGFQQAFFGADRRAYVVALEAQHSRERLRDALVIVDNQDSRRDWRGRQQFHPGIVTYRGRTAFLGG